MIKGLGNDLVEIARLERSIERHGERFVKRILNEDEFLQFLQSKQQVNFLAKRFAVKEAVSKALGTGMSNGVVWHDISVSYTEHGAPKAKLEGGALKRFNQLSASQVDIAITDESGLVSVVAIVS